MTPLLELPKLDSVVVLFSKQQVAIYVFPVRVIKDSNSEGGNSYTYMINMGFVLF